MTTPFLNSACIIATDETWSALAATWEDEFMSRVSRFERVCDVPANRAFSSYFLDELTPDIALWPLPVLASQTVGNHLGKKISAFLMRLHGEVTLEPVSPDKALRLGGSSSFDLNRFGTLVAQVADPLSSRRIMAVFSLALAGRDYFLVQMRNGTAYLLAKDSLDEADGSAVTNCVLAEDGEYFEVQQATGNTFEVPWDDVLYHCESAYEYFKGRDTSQNEDNERAASIGLRINQFRSQRGLSISGLARQANMLRPNLSRLEAGRHLPSLDTLERIADALDIPVAQLIAR